MHIEKKLDGSVLTLAVSGSLDTNTSPELEAEVKTDGVKELIFDFAGLEYISSAGLRVLLGAKKTMMPCGGRVRVLNPNTIVKDVFDTTGLSEIFEIA